MIIEYSFYKELLRGLGLGISGVYKWSDGQMFDSQRKDNIMDGKGVFKWIDDRKYEEKL